MSLSLKEMMDKAKKKGYDAAPTRDLDSKTTFKRPWEEHAKHLNSTDPDPKTKTTPSKAKPKIKNKVGNKPHRPLPNTPSLKGRRNLLERISRAQKIILSFLYRNAKEKGSAETDDFSQSELSSILNINPNTLKSAISKLIELKLIEKRKVAGWKGGANCFKFPSDVYTKLSGQEELLQDNHGEKEVK